MNTRDHITVKDQKILYIRTLENTVESLKKDNNRMAKNIEELSRENEELKLEIMRLK